MRAANSVSGRVEPHLKSIGLTARQLGVLEAVLHLGPLQQHELGKKLLVSRANVTLIIDQLAERGLVRREREIEDRRCIRVHLTAEGRRRIRKVFPEHAARIADAFSGLNAGAQEELARLCRDLGLSIQSEE
jgi:MarR family 2-MHQ and catechol resistance regulon transcriptional repressor